MTARQRFVACRVFALTGETGALLEAEAQAISRLLLDTLGQPIDASATEYHRLDVHRVEAAECRSIGRILGLAGGLPIAVG